MASVYDVIPPSPAIGCYERFQAMRRKRSSSVNARVIEETLRNRSPGERKQSTPNLNLGLEGNERFYETCLDAKNSFYSTNDGEKSIIKTKNTSNSNELKHSYSTAPRARRIWDKKNRRRSGSVPNVSFSLPPSTKPSSLTFYAPSRQHSRAEYDVTPSSTRVEKRCLQLLIDDLDSNSERTSKSKRKDLLEIDGMDSKKLSPPPPTNGRRRSLPAIFAKGRESSPLSLFKRSAPDLNEDISEVDGQCMSTVKITSKARRNSQRKIHSSWTLPIFPWKKNGHKNGISRGLEQHNLCDQALTLKTSRRDTEGGVACEPCTQNEAMTEGKQSHDSFKADDLFAMLEKVQGTRLDEQRCSLHMPAVPVEKQVEAPLYPSIQEVLRKGLPYPQVIPPPHGGYWAQGFHPDSPHLDMDVAKEPMLPYTDKLTTEREEIITSYRRHFLGKEHVNLFAYDDHLGPLVMSVKHEDSAIAESGYTRILLRCRSRSWIHRIPSADGGNPVSWAKNISQDITVDRFYPVVSTAAWNSILQFDEHSVNSANKFGILYQKPNQAKEEEVFGNQEESPAFKEFLEFIGEIVDLQGFKGFRGGLDVQHGHTGDTSVYGKYADKEVMFHVSTMLPYIEGDRQQLQRKRHIGNDIVAIVFQDGETPFVPNMITSHFLHAYIIIQAIDPCTPECRYKVSVTCREDVPEFEPSLPEPAIFAKDDTFREWLYCKMMNAEWACYKSEQFAKLQYRTRSMLLDQLYDEIQNSTESMLGMKTSVSTDNLSSASSDTVKEGSNNGFFDAFKRFTRNRAPSIEQNASPLMSNRKLGATSSESKTSISSVNNEQSKSPGGNLGRSATFDENDRQRQKGESSSLQHGNDSGNVSDLTLDYRSTQGSNPSLSGSPKKTRRNRAHSPCPSCGSYNSLDSDTGLESMASSSHTDSWPRSGKTGTFETNNNHPVDQNQNKQTSGKNYQQQQRTHITNCIDRKHSGKELDHLRNEVAKLRSEKQEWSRQQQEYMNLQKELRKLREKDLKQPNDVNNLSRKLDQIGVTDAIPTTAEHLV
ncbi:uncharacterized protein LOC120327908 isoform X7 [Styela clava]